MTIVKATLCNQLRKSLELSASSVSVKNTSDKSTGVIDKVV